ncbi:PDZ and LIM domain protein 4 [Paramormyrops kingsleyae]|uniref:PDZ and LIM domain protein 4 n=1 Tax=Paramormyrops kingsleyae TaxID=1676925 RepID=A0A3B3RJS2_9TELE|nr:PDZ and LIM domain protein 4 [Paramormyrops kingsleyae]
MPQTITLNGPSPWGFRLVGGRDFSTPLTISRITPESKAALGNLCPGDLILAINGDGTETMTHMEAQNRIKACSSQLVLVIDRTDGKVWSPTAPADDKTSPFRVCQGAELQDFRPIGSISNRKPAQYPTDPPLNNGSWKASPQYNNPAGLYANNNGDRSLSRQMSGLSFSSRQSPEPPVLSPTSRNGFNTESEVYKMLQDPAEPISEPKQSGSFRYLQEILQAEDGGVSPTDRPGRTVRSPVRSPVPRLSSPINTPLPSLQKLPLCTRCGNGIVGTIVKARDKLYHPDCFMCDDCGLNLKKRGYFFIEENLYCENCAKARVQPPEGYDVVAVYPNSKVELV